MIDKIIIRLQEKGLTIGFAESVTGGLAVAEMAKIPGASKVLKGGIIAYTNEVKTKLLGIPEDQILSHHVVSNYVARAMAENVMQTLDTSVGIGVTGDAGPTLQEGSIKRSAYFAICVHDHCIVEYMEFEDESREEVQKLIVKNIYESLDSFV